MLDGLVLRFEFVSQFEDSSFHLGEGVQYHSGSINQEHLRILAPENRLMSDLLRGGRREGTHILDVNDERMEEYVVDDSSRPGFLYRNSEEVYVRPRIE